MFEEDRVEGLLCGLPWTVDCAVRCKRWKLRVSWMRRQGVRGRVGWLWRHGVVLWGNAQVVEVVGNEQKGMSRRSLR